MPRKFAILFLSVLAIACEDEPPSPVVAGTGSSISLRAMPYSIVSASSAAPVDTLRLDDRIRFEGALQPIASGPIWRGRLATGESGYWRIERAQSAAGSRGTLEFEFRAERGGILRLGTITRGNEPELSGLAQEVEPGEWTPVRFELDAAELPEGSIRRWTLHPPQGEVELRRPLALGPGLVHPASIRLERRRQDAWVLRNDSAIEWDLDLPDSVTLQLSFAQSGSSSPRGDGLGFYVQRLGDEGELATLWSRHLAPHANPNDSGWQDLALPLAPGRFRLRVGTRSSAERTEPFRTLENVHGDRPAIGTLRLRSTVDRRPNVLVIVVDTLRGDAFDDERMPLLRDRLDEYIEFPHAYATGAWTHPSTGSLLTGWLPLAHGLGMASEGISHFRPGMRLLAERFRDAGYLSYTASHNRIVGPREGFARGVDEFEETTRGDANVRGAERLSLSAWAWLRRNAEQGPFFAYLHYFDPHDRYAPPTEFASRFLPEELDEAVPDGARKGIVNIPMRRQIDDGVDPKPEVVKVLRALYDGEVAYTDHWLDWLLTRCEAEGWFDNTIVVFTADHGEEFQEHGGFKHGHTLFEEIVRVPLALRVPGMKAGRVLDGAEVSGIDLAPTLLELCELPREELPGLSLVSWMRGETAPDRPVYFSLRGNDGSGVHGRFSSKEGAIWDRSKMWVDADLIEPVYFDLHEDRGERSAATAPGTDKAERMLEILRATLAAAEGDSSAVADDPEALERLRALGYVD